MDHRRQRYKCEEHTGRVGRTGGVGAWNRGVDRQQNCAKFVRGVHPPGKDRLFSWQPIPISLPSRALGKIFNKRKTLLKMLAPARLVGWLKSRNLTVPKIRERFGMSTWRIDRAELDLLRF